MARRAETRRRTRPRIEDHHAEWLSLVQTSGPFLTVPALKRALPDGLEATPPAIADLRVAYAEWRADPGLQQRWVRWVLDELLGLCDATAEATEADPSHLVAEHGVTLRASYVVRDRTRDGDPAVLLVYRVQAGVALDRPIPGEAWAASPLDRATELARAGGVPLALVTDGDRWALVWARPGESTGICAWQAELWLEEPLTLRAFVSLLGAKRFFNLPVEQGLAALLAESALKQQEVAAQLGSQVRRAVELLIATLDLEDRDRHGALLAQLEGAEVYRGAVTVMMRLVFLFVAEERRLLPIDDPRYEETLAASTLRAQLQERADRDGEDPLERSTAAWHRILALFRAVHGGIEHDALRLPAHGGGLFDPDRYPFLEGRSPGTSWHARAARPLPVDDRTMMHLLDALQTLEQGGARVLLSYQALDVEQIGHVYEGLLDHTALRITDTALALGGNRAIAPFDRCIVIAQTSRTMMPVLVPNGCVLSHMLVVFAYDDDAHFGLLSSGFHGSWAITHGSTMRNDIRYIPTDCFETFAQPPPTDAVSVLGAKLTDYRSSLMLDRQEGLTKTYNRMHDPGQRADDITRLRELHVELDYAVRDAYGWSDLGLGHDFHDTKFGTRFTFAPAPRQEVLDRLLELNHDRYAEETAQGLHAKPTAKGKGKAASQGAMTLGFDGV